MTIHPTSKLAASAAPSAAAGAGFIVPLGVTSSVLVKAREILTDIAAMGIRTRESIVPCIEYYYGSLDFSMDYSLLGHRYLQLIDHKYDLGRARSIYVRMVEGLKHPNCARQYAMVTNEKVAACEELTQLAFLIACAKGLKSAQLCVVGENPAYNHALIVVGEATSSQELEERVWQMNKKQQGKIVDTLRSLTGCVAVDPYLSVAFPAEDVAAQSDFLKALDAMKVTYIDLTSPGPDNKEMYDRTITEAETVRQRVQVFGGIQSVSEEEVTKFTQVVRVFDVVKGKRRDLVIELLQQKFPDSIGKWKLSPSGVLWGQFNQELAAAIHTRLTGLGVSTSNRKVTDKDAYVVQIPFKGYDAIRQVHEKCRAL